MPCGVLHAAVQAGDAPRRFARSSSGGGMPCGVLHAAVQAGECPVAFCAVPVWTVRGQKAPAKDNSPGTEYASGQNKPTLIRSTIQEISQKYPAGTTVERQ